MKNDICFCIGKHCEVKEKCFRWTSLQLIPPGQRWYLNTIENLIETKGKEMIYYSCPVCGYEEGEPNGQ